MSAAEIIEQIKALPKDELRAVVDFIDEIRRNDDVAANSRAQVRPGFHDAAREVFDRYDDLFRELAK